MKNNKLTYIFQNGRKDRLKNEEFPKEFFYGYQSISKKFNESQIISYKSGSNEKTKFNDSIRTFT